MLIIPLLYSYFYLGAFWDPYSHLKQVPVAVVNEDTGAIINGKSRNVGQEICDKLKEENTLDFTFTDRATAKEGLKGATYYAVITIPKNHSSSIASVEKATKETATITYSSNEKRNYLASQILNSAVTKIEMSLRASIDEELVTALTDKLKQAPEQLQTLSDGLGKLEAGATELTSGTSSLEKGALTLKNGASDLTKGSATLDTGAATLKEGINTLKSSSKQLVNGSQTLATGLTTYNQKWTGFQTGLNSATSGSNRLTSQLSTLKDGMKQLVDGATRLDNASASLSDLNNGAMALSTGSSTLMQGVSSYTSGVNTLLANVEATTKALSAYAAKTGDPTITQIVAGLTSKENMENLTALKDGSSSLNNAATQVASGASTLSAGTSQLSALKSGISSLKTNLIKASKGTSALETGSRSLTKGLTKLTKASNALSSASQKLGKGATSLFTGMTKLSSGIDRLNNGATTLTAGIDQLYRGSLSLKEGTTTLLHGATNLSNGSQQFTSGLTTVNKNVATSLTKANEQLPLLEGLASYAATPVQMALEPYAPVPNYGTAFAPYFLSLSLWVGGLMIFFGIYFDPDRKFKLLSRHSMNPLRRTLAYLLIGLAQAVLLCLVLMIGLGLDVNNLPLFLFGSCLVSLVFVTIIQLFLLFFQNVGKFLAIALLILQLTSCGGTFPMETVPTLFRHLYPFMPMTYSVRLFKEAISGTGDSTLIMKNVLVLTGILAVTLGITIVLSIVKKKRQGEGLLEGNEIRPRIF